VDADAVITLQGENGTASRRMPGQRRDDWHRTRCEPASEAEELLPEALDLGPLAVDQPGHVQPAAEHAGPAGEDQGAGTARLHGIERAKQLLDQRMVERIGWRTIHADLRDIFMVLNVQHVRRSRDGDQPAGRGALNI
jgi:hypothetical protein